METKKWLIPTLGLLTSLLAGNASTYKVSVFGEPVVKVERERSAGEWREQHYSKIVKRATEQLEFERVMSCTDILLKADECIDKWKAEGAE